MGRPQEVTITTLRLALRVLEGQGGTQIYGDTVAVNDKRMQSAFVQADAGDLLNTLLDRGAVELADRVGSSHEKFAAAAEPVWATVTVNTPASGAAVEIDGVVAGTAPGTIRVRPGVHEVRVTREGYATWEKERGAGGRPGAGVPLSCRPWAWPARASWRRRNAWTTSPASRAKRDACSPPRRWRAAWASRPATATSAWKACRTSR